LLQSYPKTAPSLSSLAVDPGEFLHYLYCERMGFA
jgi:hypothetical protein